MTSVLSARCESTQTEDTKRESTAQTELARVQIEQSAERSFDKTVQTDRPPQPTTVDQALSARPYQVHSPIHEQPSQHSLLSSPRGWQFLSLYPIQSVNGFYFRHINSCRRRVRIVSTRGGHRGGDGRFDRCKSVSFAARSLQRREHRRAKGAIRFIVAKRYILLLYCMLLSIFVFFRCRSADNARRPRPFAGGNISHACICLVGWKRTRSAIRPGRLGDIDAANDPYQAIVVGQRRRRVLRCSRSLLRFARQTDRRSAAARRPNDRAATPTNCSGTRSSTDCRTGLLGLGRPFVAGSATGRASTPSHRRTTAGY
jgi:hypothetical protein